MTALSFLVLAALDVAVLQWQTWLALALAQASVLLTGAHEFRWLPAGLLAAGYAYCLARLVLRAS